MSAWKKLRQQDVFITSYTAKKPYSVNSGSAFQLEGLLSIPAQSSSLYNYYIGGQAKSYGFYKTLVYRSINQLYYRDYNRATGTITGSLEKDSGSYFLSDHYEETSIVTGSRFLNEDAVVVSIPQTTYGNKIEPGSVKITPAPSTFTSSLFIDRGYVQDNYVFSGSTTYYGSIEPLVDDGNGNLGIMNSDEYIRVGNVFYSHGIAVITDNIITNYFLGTGSMAVSFTGNDDIYTHNFNVKVSDTEYNFTQNPTALTGSDNRLKDIITGSEFTPYITTVGLYNDAQELIAVGKLGQPIPKPTNTELTIKVKLDI